MKMMNVLLVTLITYLITTACTSQTSVRENKTIGIKESEINFTPDWARNSCLVSDIS